jgi:transposase
MVAQDARTAVAFLLSPGHCHDAPEGKRLLRTVSAPFFDCPMIMDRAYEGDDIRQLAVDLNFYPIVPPKSNRLNPWKYDQTLYKKRNEIERLFRRLKRFRRIFSRFDKLDSVFSGFLLFALIVDSLY